MKKEKKVEKQAVEKARIDRLSRALRANLHRRKIKKEREEIQSLPEKEKRSPEEA